jgi:hypothetical protein
MSTDQEKLIAAKQALAALKKPATKKQRVLDWLSKLDTDIRQAQASGALLKDMALAVSTDDTKVTVAELRAYLKAPPPAPAPAPVAAKATKK